MAVQGKSWLAVQARDGTEAYTRAGSLDVNAEGLLVMRNGMPVLGDGGPINIPPHSSVEIGNDGTISLTGRNDSLTQSCNGACVNLQSDPANCGACGNACASGEACTDGDCLPLVGALDGTVIVMESERVRASEAQRAQQRLQHANARVLGVVFNKRTLHVPEWLYRRL